MSKSRNSKRREFSYEEDYDSHDRKEVSRNRNRRKEKRLTTALKSKNLSLLTQLEEEFE